MRPSKLGKHECMLLLRKMQTVNELLFEFAMAGFPKEGIKNDFNLCVSLIDLYQTIEDKVKTKDKGKE